MSERGIIERESAQTCELCGAIAETRPYGPNGEEICVKCGRKDPETTERKMGEYLTGKDSRRKP